MTDTIKVLSSTAYESVLTNEVPSSCHALPTNSIFAISSCVSSVTPDTTNLTDFISLSDMSWILSK